MNNNLLISVGILQNLWEHNRQDTLDLLIPFLKCSIAKTTKVGHIIDIETTAKDFRSEFGYEDIPLDVISVMLNRLTPNTLKRKYNNYYLIAELDEEVAVFQKRKLESKEMQEKVIESLREHLTDNIPNEKFTDERVTDYLYSFFISNGLCIARNVDELMGLKRNNGRIDYEIARFIMDEYHKDTTIFHYITYLINGFFLSNALSSKFASSSTNTKMRGLTCYIDTRIIINALGLHLPVETKTSALEFLKMLKDSKVELCCFNHNYNEIYNVLLAYKQSIVNMRNRNSGNTLEAFDAQGYTPQDVDQFITVLPKKIQSLGIEIKDAPSYDETKYNKTAYIDSNGLETILKKEMNYRPHSQDSAAEADVKSAESIMLLRNGEKPLYLEKAKFIFISSSDRYCLLVEKFLNSSYSDCVPIAYSETNMSSLLWLRNYSTHQDYPQKKLIENAMAILDVPSSQFLSELFNKIDLLKSQGGITADEAAVLRMDYYKKKEIYDEAKGDSNSITDESLISAKNRLRQSYLSEENAKSELNYEKYKAEKEKNSENRKKALDAISNVGDEKYKQVKSNLTTIVNIIYVVIFIVVVFCMIQGIYDNSIFTIICSSVVLVFDIIGFFDLLKEKRHIIINRWIHIIATKEADKAMDKKREEYEQLFGNLME